MPGVSKHHPRPPANPANATYWRDRARAAEAWAAALQSEMDPREMSASQRAWVLDLRRQWQVAKGER